MSLGGADTELILISEAVARLEAGLFRGEVERPNAVRSV
jgi:hypothetical protein